MTTIDKLNKYKCDKEIRHYFFFFELDEFQAAYVVKFCRELERDGDRAATASNHVQGKNLT